MVPFSPAQPDALPTLTVLFCLAQSDALRRLGLSLLLDLMVEANGYQTMAVSWSSVTGRIEGLAVAYVDDFMVAIHEESPLGQKHFSDVKALYEWGE